MNELTDSNRRKRSRNSKSKDFQGSPLEGMFNDQTTSNENNIDNKKENEETKVEQNQNVTSNEDTVIIQPSVEKNTPSPTVTGSDIFSSLPKKKEAKEIVTKNMNGKYILQHNEVFHRVKKISKTVTLREDIAKIIDDISMKKDGSGQYSRGIKSAVVNNAVLKELFQMGLIGKEDMEQEIEPYEF
ncbi:hypothetical protein [Liquorilactobacillus hordei]|uniref:Uncharacterized protein n=1 Tax=Liquorilactobacillus hordei DSM 19519 TaxID=1423759 RepID=A0A0R1MU13_9LACO|nr:hypothetical protein [Liquorilactobacillus hordei]KRL07907.1 hypothetical protein FC92_GL000974 [Liquorilactobacillus hordei DSM 19519]QYH50999.1 hypothetical protein G6O70_00090 [Liquorilactobacillus hordei DSM 19519]QYH51146.1 hypothetical protein G6O70_00885 [Liquorilactobacillus hordei DSM 19519]